MSDKISNTLTLSSSSIPDKDKLDKPLPIRTSRLSSSSSSHASSRSSSIESSSPDKSMKKKKSKNDVSRSRSRSFEKKKKSRRAEKKKDKEKKNKKDKQKKKKKEKSAYDHPFSINQDYGKYGVITMADYTKKKEEFNCWLNEVKSTNVERLSNYAEKQLWEDFMEDYNTATLPSKKYYNLRKWEARQQEKLEKEKQKQQRKAKKLRLGGDYEFSVLNDEAERIKERKLERERLQHEKFKAAYMQLNEDRDKIEAMREEQNANNLMKHYYKTGNMEEAIKLQERFGIKSGKRPQLPIDIGGGGGEEEQE